MIEMMEGFVPLSTGIEVPFTKWVNSAQTSQSLIMCHGLGAKNPKLKSHLGDDWVKMLQQAAADDPNHTVDVSIAYTARGHGASTGWMDTVLSDPYQFTWDRLSLDLISVADSFGLDRFIASGSSMGSATALYAAIQFPERVEALILVRPPTAWEERLARRMNLLSSANKCAKENGPDDIYHHVLRGAALADLPPVGLEESPYSRITCPTLILTIQGDDAHPVKTAEVLAENIARSQLHVAASVADSRRDWPSIIVDFLQQVKSYAEHGSTAHV